MTVYELGERVSSLEMTYWQEYYKIVADEHERAAKKKPATNTED